MNKIRVIVYSITALIIIVSNTNPTFGQYNISVKIKGAEHKKIYLAHYYGDKNYVVDTILLDKQGQGAFKGSHTLKEGIYLIVLPARNYIDIIIDQDQNFAIETDTSADMRTMVNKMKITGSVSNTEFRDYQIFMFDKTKEAHLQKVNSLDKTLTEKQRQKSAKQLNIISNEITEKQKQIIKTSPDKILSKLVKAFEEPEVPQYGTTVDGVVVDSTYQYNYYKDHYFDNIDLTDSRLIRTPVYHNRLSKYFDNVVSPATDSIINASDKLIQKTETNSELFQYTLQYIFNKYSQSKIMGHDKITVYLADKYYLNGKAQWADSVYLAKLSDRIARMRPNVIGATAPALDKAQTPDGMFYPLSTVKGKVIALIFWEPECGHCKKEIPQLVDIFNQYHQKGFEVYAFYTQNKIVEWKQSIESLGMEAFINVYDPYNFTSFRDKYDIYSTPTLYLLDSNLKIIAKRISLEAVNDILEDLLTQ